MKKVYERKEELEEGDVPKEADLPCNLPLSDPQKTLKDGTPRHIVLFEQRTPASLWRGKRAQR